MGPHRSWVRYFLAFNPHYLILIVVQGLLVSQFLLGRIQEQTMFTSLLLTQSFTAFVIQMLGFGSAAMFYISALPLFFVLVLNRFIARQGQISLWTYALGQLTPLMTSTILMMSVSEVFVPLVRHKFDIVVRILLTIYLLDWSYRGRCPGRFHCRIYCIHYWRTISTARVAVCSPLSSRCACARNTSIQLCYGIIDGGVLDLGAV